MKSDATALAVGIDWDLSPGWSVAMDANYGRSDGYQFGQVISPTINAPFEYEILSDLWSISAVANGTLFDLPGGELKSAFGAQFRREGLDRGQVGRPRTIDGSRNVSAVFAEAAIPLIGAGNEIRAIKRLELNLSGRYDDYSDMGSSFNPKVGLHWMPSEPLSLRASYSTSFAPPSLGQTGTVSRAGAAAPYAWLLNNLGVAMPDPSLEDVNYIIVGGVSPDLGPEESRSFTAGFDYKVSDARNSLALSATYYDISFEGRLGSTPVPGNLTPNHAPGMAFMNPDLFPVGVITFFPSEAEIQSTIDSITNLSFGGGLASIGNIGFINRVQMIRNLASTETRGMDFRLSYGRDTGLGYIDLGFNANYIINLSHKASDATPEVEILGTLYNPVDLTVRGRASLMTGGFLAGVAVSYVDSYRNDSTSDSMKIGSWTTWDASLSYDFGLSRGSLLSSVRTSLIVSNLLNRSPPVVPPYGTYKLPGYDPANASPIGRYISLEITKRF